MTRAVGMLPRHQRSRPDPVKRRARVAAWCRVACSYRSCGLHSEAHAQVIVFTTLLFIVSTTLLFIVSTTSSTCAHSCLHTAAHSCSNSANWDAEVVHTWILDDEQRLELLLVWLDLDWYPLDGPDFPRHAVAPPPPVLPRHDAHSSPPHLDARSPLTPPVARAEYETTASRACAR